MADAIDAVHRQGGVAIAAHPYEGAWPAFNADALRVLDGAEVVRPEAQHDESLASQLRAFFDRAALTAIGSSDYHGLWSVGYSRTYVFARTRTEAGVLDALREGRTVVCDRERTYGDPAMMQMMQIESANGGLPRTLPELPVPGAARCFSRIAGLLALLALVLFNRWGVNGDGA